MDAGEVGGRVVAVVRVSAAAVDGRGGCGVHRLGLDLGGRLARYQVLRGVLLLLLVLLVLLHRQLLVLVVRPRVVHRRFVVVVQAVAVAVVSAAATAAATASTAVGTIARVVVVVAVGPAARRAGTVLGRPLGQVHAGDRAARRWVRRSLVVVAFQRYRRVFLRAKNVKRNVKKLKKKKKEIEFRVLLIYIILYTGQRGINIIISDVILWSRSPCARELRRKQFYNNSAHSVHISISSNRIYSASVWNSIRKEEPILYVRKTRTKML